MIEPERKVKEEKVNKIDRDNVIRSKVLYLIAFTFNKLQSNETCDQSPKLTGKNHQSHHSQKLLKFPNNKIDVDKSARIASQLQSNKIFE